MNKDNPLIERIRDVRHQISEGYHHDPIGMRRRGQTNKIDQ